MPYIEQERRELLQDYRVPSNPGELNYMITKLCLDSDNIDNLYSSLNKLVHRYLGALNVSYGAINGVVGALECAKMEYFRRLGEEANDRVEHIINKVKKEFYNEIAIPYENLKIKENGDVY